MAGNETTRNAISHGMLALLEHPDQRARLRDDPDRCWTRPSRRSCAGRRPVMHFRRTATRDTELGGQAIAEGDKVVIWYISANRDEDVFDDPYTLRHRRAPTNPTSTSPSAAAARTSASAPTWPGPRSG